MLKPVKGRVIILDIKIDDNFEAQEGSTLLLKTKDPNQLARGIVKAIGTDVTDLTVGCEVLFGPGMGVLVKGKDGVSYRLMAETEVLAYESEDEE